MKTLICLFLSLLSLLSSAQSLQDSEKLLASSSQHDMIFGGTRIGKHLYLSIVGTDGYIFFITKRTSKLYKYNLDLKPVDSTNISSQLGFDYSVSNRMKAFGDTCFVSIELGMKDGKASQVFAVIDTNLNIQESYLPGFGSDTTVYNLDDVFLTAQHLLVVGSALTDSSRKPSPMYMVFNRATGQRIYTQVLTSLKNGVAHFSSAVRFKNKYVLSTTLAGDSTGAMDPVTLNLDFTLDSIHPFNQPHYFDLASFALFEAAGTLYGFGRSLGKSLGMLKYDSNFAISRTDTYNLHLNTKTIVGNDNFVKAGDTSFIMVGGQDPALSPYRLDSTDARDIVLYKVGASGTVLCSNIIPGEHFYFPMHVISAPDGGAFIFANKFNHETFAQNKTDLVVIKVDGNCQLEKLLSTRSHKTDVEKLSVYPNPTTCEVTLAGISPYENLSVKVYNNLGMLVLQKNLRQSRNFRLCEAGAPGLYVLQFLNEGNEVISRTKMIIK